METLQVKAIELHKIEIRFVLCPQIVFSLKLKALSFQGDILLIIEPTRLYTPFQQTCTSVVLMLARRWPNIKTAHPFVPQAFFHSN